MQLERGLSEGILLKFFSSSSLNGTMNNMKKLAFGSQIIVAGIAQAAGAMAGIIGSMPRAIVGQYEPPINVKPRKDAVRFRHNSSKVKLGDFEDDIEALRRDMLVLGEDMKKARMRVL